MPDPKITVQRYLEQRINSLEKRFEEHWKAHDKVHEMGQKTLDTTLQRLDERFEGVNKFREQVLEERLVFLRMDVYEREHKALELKVDISNKWIDNMNGRLWAAGAIILALSTVIGLALRFWGK